MVQISRGGRQHPSRKLSVSRILLTIVLCGASFYSGTLSGMRNRDQEVKCDSPGSGLVNNNEPESSNNDAKIEAIVQQRLQAGKL